MNNRILATITLGAILLFGLVWMSCSESSDAVTGPAGSDYSLRTGFDGENTCESDDISLETYDPAKDGLIDADYDRNTGEDEESYESDNPNDKGQDDDPGGDDWNPNNPKNKDNGV